VSSAAANVEDGLAVAEEHRLVGEEHCAPFTTTAPAVAKTGAASLPFIS